MTRYAPTGRIARRGSQATALTSLAERGGSEFDPELVTALVALMRQWEPHVAVHDHEHAAVIPAGPAPAGGT